MTLELARPEGPAVRFSIDRSTGDTGTLVTVLLPVHNGGEYLLPALTSVLEQSHRALDVLILDDGSTDGAVDDAVAAVSDTRVRMLRHRNIGLAATLNRGLDEARGMYIARMDADDIALPGRIAQQVALLDREPGVVLVGGQILRMVAGAATGAPTAFPAEHDKIVRGLLTTEHVLCHPSVMFRTASARRIGGYWSHGPAEDWDFFLRMSEQGGVANVLDTVLLYRFHESGINAQSMKCVRTNMRLAVLNYRRRQNARRELIPLDFASARWTVTRFLVGLQVRSLTSYRRSLRARGEGRRARALLLLGLSALLWPRQAARRIVHPRPVLRTAVALPAFLTGAGAASTGRSPDFDGSTATMTRRADASSSSMLHA